MTKLIVFRTDRFDVSKESQHPIHPELNPHGEALLLWVRQQANEDFHVGELEDQEIGWFVLSKWKGKTYSFGCCVSGEDEGDTGMDREWQLQIGKLRSLKESILGRGKLDMSDECFSYIYRLIESQPDFREVTVL